jgi:urease accessory protein
MRRTLLTLPAITFALIPTLASAHTGLGDAHDLAHGFMHPIGGLDHVLAMVAVGLFAAHLGGRALWLVPASFVLVMAAGGVIGMAGIGLPFVEVGIALSVIVLGLAIALRLNLPVAAAMALVGVFAVFHGHAHGTEMPESIAGLGYGLGFVAATATLHAVGVGFGLLVGTVEGASGRRILQAAGGAAAVIGAALLVQAI